MSDSSELCPNWLDLASEVWALIFSHLDVVSHVRLEKTCRELNELGQSDFLWEIHCKFYFTKNSCWYPKKTSSEDQEDKTTEAEKIERNGKKKYSTDIIVGWNEEGYELVDNLGDGPLPDSEEDAPPSKPRFIDPNSSWRQVFQKLLEFRIEGDFYYWVKMANSVFPNVIKYGVRMIQLNPSSFLQEEFQTKIPTIPVEENLLPACIFGGGKAPWGMCDLTGVKFGNFMSLIYNYYHHDFLIVGLYEFTLENRASVVWTSDWNNNSGSSIVSEANIGHDDLWSTLDPILTSSPDREKNVEKLRGNWRISFESISENLESFQVEIPKRFQIHKGGGFSGEITAHSEPSPVKFIGITNSNDMVSFGTKSKISEEEWKKIAMIGEIVERKEGLASLIKGNYVSSIEGSHETDQFNTGHFTATRIYKEKG